MKIEIKYYGNTYTVETEHDIFTGLLIQLGYQQQSINETIKELADERHN